MRTVCVLALVGGIVLCGSTDAEAQRATFRRPEVMKLVQQNDWTHLATAVKVKGGLVVGACEKAFEGGRPTAKLSWVLVPLDRKQQVRILTGKEVRGYGLRTKVEARQLAGKLGADARYAEGIPYSDLTFAGITTHHAKHQGTGLSYLFTAAPAQPLDAGLHPHDSGTRVMIKRVGFSVPVLRSQKRGESAWRNLVEFVPVSAQP